jgi:branched-chain amino acid transport system substrate-binding protein
VVRRRGATTLVAVVLALVATACGSRLTTEELQAQGSVAPTSAPAVGRLADGAVAAGSAGGPVSTSVTAPTSANGASPASAANAGTEAPGGAVKAPIVVGVIGYFSGIGGGALTSGRDAWVAWSKAVNAAGGINGHPVRLLIGDDGGNGARSIALARDFVESKHAIALSYVGINMPLRAYVESKSIPVIGSNPTTYDWFESPMLFTPSAGADGLLWGTPAVMKRTGKSKVAFLYCAEVADCGQRFAPATREAGLQVVYEGKYSIAQPDFTAECLQIRNAGAEIVMMLGDANSLVRAAQSCGRQNVKPIWMAPAPDDALASRPELQGVIGVTQAFPWFLRSGSPAIDEYETALRRYAPNRLTNGGTAQSLAWTAAKTLEHAAASVSATPTNTDILRGLWSMRGETLGGLLSGRQALTFRQGRGSTDPFCVFEVRVVNNTWQAPLGPAPLCR